MNRHKVVIIGGGFGGLHAARSLRRAPVEVTLIDRRNFHLFQPLLYQVATGGLSPANIAAPLRSILRRQKNVKVRLAEVINIDPVDKSVLLRKERVPFDSLIIAAGATHSYFGNVKWAPLAPGLKTIEDATDIRGRILAAFEEAELESDSKIRQALMTFVIVGGGPTGVELAGAISELARHTLKSDFRNINPADAKIMLLDAQARILGAFPQKLSDKATRSLSRLGVEVRTNTRVTDISESRVMIESAGQRSTISTRSVLWAAGVQASPLAAAVAQATGVETDRAGRILVNEDCSVDGYRDIFVIGDMANLSHQTGAPLPGVAPVAIQQGRYVARLIEKRLAGEMYDKPFQYRDAGSLATIGRSAAVADFGKLQFSGFFAWLVWLFVHLMQIVQHQSRVLVFIQWAWNYWTFNRSARLITKTLAESAIDFKPSTENEADEEMVE